MKAAVGRDYARRLGNVLPRIPRSREENARLRFLAVPNGRERLGRLRFAAAREPVFRDRLW